MRRAAREAVRQFFDAVRRESVPKLEAVLTEEAVLHAGPGTGSQQAAKVWASRFKRLDYERGDARRVFREDELELYAPSELPRLDPPRHFVLAPREGELLAVANVHEQRTPGAGTPFRSTHRVHPTATRQRLPHPRSLRRLPSAVGGSPIPLHPREDLVGFAGGDELELVIGDLAVPD